MVRVSRQQDFAFYIQGDVVYSIDQYAHNCCLHVVEIRKYKKTVTTSLGTIERIQTLLQNLLESNRYEICS